MLLNRIINLIHEIQEIKNISEKKALIIIDYTDQNVNKNEKTEWDLSLSKVKQIKTRIEELINFCRSRNYPIIFIGTTEWSEQNLPYNINHLYQTNPEAAFYSQGKDSFIISPKSTDTVFYKNKYSAFSGTQGKLERYLKEQKINNLVICGIYSTGCVKDTLAEGFAKGYHLTIIKDCVETFDRKDKQQYQKLLLQDWTYMYGPVVTLNDFKNK